MSESIQKCTGVCAKRYDSCDLMKFIFSILVFGMHINLFRDVSTTASHIWRLFAQGGVPFFFISSSFFLFRKQDEDGRIEREALIKYLHRVACLYLVWFIINLPSVAYESVFLKGIGSISTYTFLLKTALLSSTYTGSWFMLSCMFSALVMFTLSKYFNSNKILLITFPLFLCCMLGRMPSELLPAAVERVLSAFMFPLNIFTGLFYFAIGKFIAEHQERMEKIPLSHSVGLCIGSYALLFAGFFILRHFGFEGWAYVEVFVAPVAFFCFIFAINCDRQIAHSRELRKMSTIIYCSQGNILYSPGVVKRLFHVPELHSMLCFAACCAAEIVVIVIVMYLQKKRRDRAFVRYLT